MMSEDELTDELNETRLVSGQDAYRVGDTVTLLIDGQERHGTVYEMTTRGAAYGIWLREYEVMLTDLPRGQVGTATLEKDALGGHYVKDLRITQRY